MINRIEQWIDDTNHNFQSQRISCSTFDTVFVGFYSSQLIIVLTSSFFDLPFQLFDLLVKGIDHSPSAFATVGLTPRLGRCNLPAFTMLGTNISFVVSFDGCEPLVREH